MGKGDRLMQIVGQRLGREIDSGSRTEAGEGDSRTEAGEGDRLR